MTLGITHEPTTRAPTVGVATPTQDAIFCADEPRNSTRHDADKPTPSVATPTVATPIKRFHTCIADEPRDSLRHDIKEPTLSVATPTVETATRIPHQAKRSIEMPRHDTHKPTPSVETPTKDSTCSVHELGEGTRQDAGKSTPRRRNACRREADSRFMIPGKPQDTTLAKQRRTSRRRLKMPSVANMRLGSHKDMTLANRRPALRRLSTRRRLKI
jgi:hypothetical protein